MIIATALRKSKFVPCGGFISTSVPFQSNETSKVIRLLSMRQNMSAINQRSLLCPFATGDAAIIEQSGRALCSISSEHKIRYCNRHLTVVSGYKLGTKIGIGSNRVANRTQNQIVRYFSNCSALRSIIHSNREIIYFNCSIQSPVEEQQWQTVRRVQINASSRFNESESGFECSPIELRRLFREMVGKWSANKFISSRCFSFYF